jgi:hypothetical protein
LGDLAPSFEFEPCYWAPILQRQQDRTWKCLLQAGEMDALELRRWIVSAFGDPATYLSGFFKTDKPVYGEVHECIRSSLAILGRRLQNTADAPLVVLAHSLGSVIVSNYIWDENHGQPIGRTPLERMDTLTGLLTYGSNIPLFLPPAPPITCIRFPPPVLPPRLEPAAAWENVFDPDDVLGYPLRTIWDETQGTVIRDIAINVGIWPLSETPLSHMYYDRDGDFLAIVERRLRAILAVA